jgi:hypothetical protein
MGPEKDVGRKKSLLARWSRLLRRSNRSNVASLEEGRRRRAVADELLGGHLLGTGCGLSREVRGDWRRGNQVAESVK